MTAIGITERGDAALHYDWLSWVRKGKPAILITKDPQKLLDVLVTTFLEPPNIIVHCTITGYGGTAMEPNVPPPSESLKGYHEMVKYLGKDRVVLRVDPIVVTPDGVELAKKILSEAEGRTRISFLDMYVHVGLRMIRAGMRLPHEDFHAPLGDRVAAWRYLGWPDVCGEPGLPSVGCVSEIDCKILGVEPSKSRSRQRWECRCLANKKELLDHKGRCEHQCIYCYWKDE